jgi:hypothetical protein
MRVSSKIVNLADSSYGFGEYNEFEWVLENTRD